jgi:hypothetical protein
LFTRADGDGQPDADAKCEPKRNGDGLPDGHGQPDADRDGESNANAQSGAHREPHAPSDGKPNVAAITDRGCAVAADGHAVVGAHVCSHG